jgi:hypothetical protein
MMRTRTIRFALLGAMTAGVVLTQQACANGTAVEPAAAPASSQAAAPETAPSEPGDTGSEGPSEDDDESSGEGSGDGSIPVCKTKDLEANITLQPGGEGSTRKGLVTLTNKSGTECTAQGRATIALKNPAGETVDVPTQNVEQPGKAARTALKSGSSVFQGIKWTACDKGDSSCGAGNALVFSIGSSGDGKAAKLSNFPAAEKNDITMKSLKIGTIQLSRQGVVAW